MADSLYIVPVLLMSVVLHEIAHGVVALWCGDPTAKEMGRLTLNPIPHIDLIGSIIVPLISLLSVGRVFIAWAKPVPINPYNFRHGKRDDILVSAAGPVTNFLVAAFCTIAVILAVKILNLMDATSPEVVKDFGDYLVKMFYSGIYLNIVLAVFNLIPVPPLDGSHVLASFLPDEAANSYRSVGFFGIFIIIILMDIPLVNRIFFSLINILAFPFIEIIRLFA